MKIALRDGCFYAFGGRSATLGGDNQGQGPTTFEWIDEEGEGPYTFYTDVCLEQAIDDPGKKVAWLVEPPGMGRTHYERIEELEEHFDFVLSFVTRPGLFYPLGGSWITSHDWGLHDKTKEVSLIASEKDITEGHKLRHAIAKGYWPESLDLFGKGYYPIDSTAEGLRDYRYSIVVESWRGDWYFSEKLIDCISQGTVPIYWGCPDLWHFFDLEGIIRFENMDELGAILALIGPDDYARRLPALQANLKRAERYRCAEDWMYGRYPSLFGAE